MKVLHFILGKANKDRANGVNQVIAGLAKYSARLGADIRVIGKAESASHEGERVFCDGFFVEAYCHWGEPLRTALYDGIRWADVVHLHGVYSVWNLLVSRMCDQVGRPYVVTLHDGLAPERALVRGRYKKAIFNAVAQRRHLANAAAVHVLTEEEATDLFAVVRPKRVFCIPNGVDLDDYPVARGHNRCSLGTISIGYLGRLSAEKNIEALCEAFAIANKEKNMQLLLAGPPSTYGEGLLDRYSTYGVIGVGPKFGLEKADFIRSLDLFVHPSLCDVFSIAAMEVLALGTPLLITRTSKASYFFDRGAYFMCEPTVFGIENGLRLAMRRQEEWPVMGKSGRCLIEERMNWRVAAIDMLAAYSHIKTGQS